VTIIEQSNVCPPFIVTEPIGSVEVYEQDWKGTMKTLLKMFFNHKYGHKIKKSRRKKNGEISRNNDNYK